MIGHLLARLWCRLVGHTDRLWTVNALGGGWVCTRCLHWTPSIAMSHPPRASVSRVARRDPARGEPPTSRDLESCTREELAARLRALTLTLALETRVPAATRQALAAQRRAITQEQIRRAVARTVTR